MQRSVCGPRQILELKSAEVEAFGLDNLPSALSSISLFPTDDHSFKLKTRNKEKVLSLRSSSASKSE